MSGGMNRDKYIRAVGNSDMVDSANSLYHRRSATAK
jgi:hypothetical protein